MTLADGVDLSNQRIDHGLDLGLDQGLAHGTHQGYGLPIKAMKDYAVKTVQRRSMNSSILKFSDDESASQRWNDGLESRLTKLSSLTQNGESKLLFKNCFGIDDSDFYIWKRKFEQLL